MMRVLIAARTIGVPAIDGPFGNFTDATAFVEAAGRAAAIGFDGKWAIHPTQIDALNSVFSPTMEVIDRARSVLEAVRDANAKGAGAITFEGELVDLASIRQAEAVLSRANR